MIKVKEFTSTAELLAHYRAVHARLYNCTWSKPILEELPPPPRPQQMSVSLVLAAAAQVANIGVPQLLGDGRTGAQVLGRRIACVLLKKYRPRLTTADIARALHKDHTSIHYIYRQLMRKMISIPTNKLEQARTIINHAVHPEGDENVRIVWPDRPQPATDRRRTYHPTINADVCGDGGEQPQPAATGEESADDRRQ